MIPVEILRQVRRLQIRARRAVNSLVAGDYHSAFKGSGLNFDEVREYSPGDDVRAIDWNVTARMDKPFLKRFVEERELAILLAVDLSGSLEFGSTKLTKRTVAAEIAALLSFAALQNGDRVGFLGFNDCVEHYLRPRRGAKQVVRCLREILAPREARGTDLSKAFVEINRILRRRSVIFFISDFQEILRDSDLRRVAAKHDLIAVRITDPLELAWPLNRSMRLQDAETGEVKYVSPQAIRAVIDERKRRRGEFEKLTRAADVELLDLTTQGDHFDRLLAFLRRRGR